MWRPKAVFEQVASAREKVKKVVMDLRSKYVSEFRVGDNDRRFPMRRITSWRLGRTADPRRQSDEFVVAIVECVEIAKTHETLMVCLWLVQRCGVCCL